MSYTYEYPRASVAVDAAVFARRTGLLHILLIQRKNDPFKGKWALPGGFIEMDETLEESAHRELKEETGISVTGLKQLRAFGDPGRDPRGRTISVVFYCVIETLPQETQAGDDARDAKWFPVDKLPVLAFDHDEIVAEAVQRLREEARRK